LGANKPSIGTTQSAETLTSLSFAKVVLDSSVPHLDREFDYLISPAMASKIRVGSRVQLPFGRQKMLGWVIERSASSKFSSKISNIAKVIGENEQFNFETLRLAKITAEYFGGNLSDVLRFCAPPRHATIEKNFKGEKTLHYPTLTARLDGFSAGDALLKRIGVHTQAQLLLPINGDWMLTASELIKATISKRKNVLIVVPDNVLVNQLAKKIESIDPSLTITKLSADLPANIRYQNYLEILHSQTQVVVGTRNAIFTPLSNVGLILIVNETSDLHSSPQAPYWNASKVAQFRSQIEDSCLVYLGNSLSIENYQQIYKNEIKLIRPIQTQINSHKIIFDDGQTQLNKSQFSSSVWQAINHAKEGPVLVQVPRRGEAALLRCGNCYRIANCGSCEGVLRIVDKKTGPECSRCARINLDFRCSGCKSTSYKISQQGQSAILQELGKMFPNLRIISSTGAKRVLTVPDTPVIVVATENAAPAVEGAGYRSIVVLNIEAQFTRPSLNLYQDVFHQWMSLLSLLSNSQGSNLVLSGEVEPNFANFFTNADVMGFNEYELKMREDLSLPPHRDALVLKGVKKEVELFKSEFAAEPGLEIFGPVELFGEEKLYQVAFLTKQLLPLVLKVRNMIKTVSAKRKSSVQIQVNPIDFI
jgi:primosomal protein N' (replication factor Y)